MLDFDAKYEISSFVVGDTKAGTKMGKMQLRNLGDNSVLNCVLWEETLNRMSDAALRAGNIIKIVTASYNEKFNNCLLNNFQVLEQACLGLDEGEREEYYQKIVRHVALIKDEKLKKFVSDLLKEHETQFKIAPAAKQMHHNYIGGLLVHTLECIEIALAVLPHFKKPVSSDEAIAGIVLHDFGKVFEYTINTESGLIDYNEQFRKDWISHSQWGYSLCMQEGYKTIAKMIASHHARIDWGAMIDLGEKDLEPFYYLIHHVDDLSAKFGATGVNDLKNKKNQEIG